MFGREELWGELEPVLAECGLELFDLDLPGRQAGVLRVYVSKPVSAKGGVTVDECELVSRKIASHPKLGVILESCALEVSSPGINRTLRRPEHFRGAVGERVQIIAKSGPRPGQPLTGKLLACNGTCVVLAPEEGGGRLCFGLNEIIKARVDFLFAK